MGGQPDGGNVFIVTVTMWCPDLATRTGPRYLAIADALADDIRGGRLATGQRLPTHRDLADRLGVTVGTVSRAYREAIDRGLVNGEVGRGTYVRASETLPTRPSMELRDPTDRSRIDLSLNFLRVPAYDDAVAQTLARLAQERDVAALFDEYKPQPGIAAHREAGARWVADAGLDVAADQVLVCAGAQHAMTVGVLGLTRPGDSIVAGEVTYPTMITLARVLHRPLRGVAMDREGIIPEALDAVCRAHRPRLLYCMPSVQNPSAAVMSVERRKAIAEIAMRHRLAVLEDDVYGFLLDEPLPPLVQFMGEGGYFLTSLSKSVAPGLRVGYLVTPRGEAGRFLDALWATAVMAPPPTAEIAARWIHDGTAAAMARARRIEAGARQRIAAAVLAGCDLDRHANAFHVWLRLPAPSRSAGFVACALQRGIAVVPGEAFAVGELRQPAVRVSLGPPRDHDELRRGLGVLADLLGGSDAPGVV
ncbi:MAG TPA: PLP-dependent aminotransferase family protein [Nannocystaceae bacterium]|nr:PLP-dependent aminotransferase family protein [Nannocystaceae bacterium]